MQEIKSRRVIMTAVMEEMKQQSQFMRENLIEMRQPKQEVASKLEIQSSNELGGSILKTYKKLVNFTAHLCKQRLNTFLLIGENVVLWKT